MKFITAFSVFCLISQVDASDFREKLISAAKDKKNQEQAKELALKGIEYIKNEQKIELKPEVATAPVPAPAPTDAKLSKKAPLKKKKSKK